MSPGQGEFPRPPGHPRPGGDRGPGGAARARAAGVRPLVRGRGELQPRHSRGPAPEHLPGEAAGHGGGAVQADMSAVFDHVGMKILYTLLPCKKGPNPNGCKN